MAEDTFVKVIEVEREVKESISRERQRVDQWLEKAKKEMSVQYRNELKKLREEVALSRETKTRQAENEIRDTLEEARHRAQLIEKIDDKELKGLVENLLRQLIPGKAS